MKCSFLSMGGFLAVSSFLFWLRRAGHKKRVGAPSSFLNNPKKQVVVTGGTGYIGSHTIVSLLEGGYKVTCIDNLINSSPTVMDSIRSIVEAHFAEKDGEDVPFDFESHFQFFQVDLTDKTALSDVFAKIGQVHACIHFAGLKAVGESTSEPLLYYRNNVFGSINLLEVLSEYSVPNLVFSSSATVYGSAPLPLTEEDDSREGLSDYRFDFSIANPYGKTKFMIEQMVLDLCKSNPSMNGVILRYFNPIGAHSSGLLGDAPTLYKAPNNLLPYVVKVLSGELEHLTVFGDDYETKDGTGERDYIHIEDLASGHLSALTYLDATQEEEEEKEEDGSNFHIFNLGRGSGISVLEIIRAMETASNQSVNYKIGPRRDGDLAKVFANTKKAKEELVWEAQYSIEDMCNSLVHYQEVQAKKQA